MLKPQSASGRHAAAIQNWAEDRYDQPISESDIQQVASEENWVDMAKFNMQLHGDLVSLMEERTEGFETLRNTKAEVGLDAGRRLNHKCDPRNPLRNIQLLERLLAPTKVVLDVRVVRQRFGNEVENLWKSIHMVCIQKICPKILRDHLAVQAASIDSPEKQRLTIEKFRQANVHRTRASPMDVDARAKTNGGKKGGKGTDKGSKSEKFGGNCNWRSVYGHMQKDCWAKAAEKPKVPRSPRGPDLKPKGNSKGGKGKKGASSLDEALAPMLSTLGWVRESI